MAPTTEELVQEWLRLDKEEHTRDEIEQLWQQQNLEELEARLRTRIDFGTAARLRGRMEAGFARMNSLTIIQASQGLAAYVSSTVPDATSRGVVIGRDHRHNSEHWANLTAAVFVNFGFKVYLLEGLSHTPLVPFSVSRLKASCGVMITASHNPKDDNGYKVYWENAIQIIGPHDKGIAKAILEHMQPRIWDAESYKSSNLLINKTNEMRENYFSYLETLSKTKHLNSKTDLKFVSTPMHGVGYYYSVKAFETFGLLPFTVVERQKNPDPDFPTVKFPNPEEKGALDLAIQEAGKIGADYVLAQDPDADRFVAAERRENNQWTIFSGDMLGAIFASRAMELYLAEGKPINKLAMVASTVSSKFLEVMAQAEGFRSAECLTGFKYIGNTVLDLVKQGYEVPFAYEEAIGFMIGSEIRDKDGISATVYFAELAADLRRRNMTVSQYLKILFSKYGIFQTCNNYYICTSPSTIDRIFSRLRNFNQEGNGTNYPREIGGLQVIWVRDLTTGYDSERPPTYKPELPLSSGHMIQFKAKSLSGTEAINLTLRTSGTEPKIKYYLEGQGKDTTLVKDVLAKVVDDLTHVWIQAKENDLTIPDFLLNTV